MTTDNATPITEFLTTARSSKVCLTNDQLNTIVRAVNAHDEFVEVCKAIEASGFLSDKNGDESGGHLLADLRQALAKAERK